MRRRALDERVLRDPETGCWLWQGERDHKGYGRVRIGGRRIAAHRAMYEQEVGPIPDGLDILHSCDNPPCVNPAHLRPGTQAENMRDMIEKGRSRNQNGWQTHCPHGHPYSPENTYTHSGRRSCRTCSNIRRRERHRRVAATRTTGGGSDG